MAYGLYRTGKGGKLRKIRGNPRSPTNQRNMIVWNSRKKGIKTWIRKWGTKTQKEKHIKFKRKKRRK
jgi:hypothetical protein